MAKSPKAASDADSDLVRRAQQGDREAFSSLIGRHQATIAGLMLALLHDLETAEDCTRDVFLKAFRKLRSFRGRSSFKAWITRIALGAARSERRWTRLRSWLTFPKADGEGESEGGLLRAAASDEAALGRRQELDRALEGLGRREREIAALRLEGYSLADIAEALSIGERAVKSMLFTSTRSMRKRLH